jgi:hypothetical protein
MAYIDFTIWHSSLVYLVGRSKIRCVACTPIKDGSSSEDLPIRRVVYPIRDGCQTTHLPGIDIGCTLSMISIAIGGYTAIELQEGKNLLLLRNGQFQKFFLS